MYGLFCISVIPRSLPYVQKRTGNAHRITVSYTHLSIGQQIWAQGNMVSWISQIIICSNLLPYAQICYPILKCIRDNVILYALPVRICIQGNDCGTTDFHNFGKTLVQSQNIFSIEITSLYIEVPQTTFCLDFLRGVDLKKFPESLKIFTKSNKL